MEIRTKKVGGRERERERKREREREREALYMKQKDQKLLQQGRRERYKFAG